MLRRSARTISGRDFKLADYELKIEGIEELLTKVRDAKVLQEPLRDFFNRAGYEVEGQVRMITPVGVSGDLSGSIHYALDTSPVPLFAIIDTRLSPHYGPDVEFGTAPHMPPHDAIYRWAWLNRGKFEIKRNYKQTTKDEVESLTQRIRWKIYHYGTKGHFMFKHGLANSVSKIQGYAKELLDSIKDEWLK